jgi:hypothetical protein
MTVKFLIDGCSFSGEIEFTNSVDGSNDGMFELVNCTFSSSVAISDSYVIIRDSETIREFELIISRSKAILENCICDDLIIFVEDCGQIRLRNCNYPQYIVFDVGGGEGMGSYCSLEDCNMTLGTHFVVSATGILEKSNVPGNSGSGKTAKFNIEARWGDWVPL